MIRVHMETGNLVPADYRLLESFNLQIQEASLTGELEPIDKNTETLGQPDGSRLPQRDLSLADRHNIAYMGTVINYGHRFLISLSLSIVIFEAIELEKLLFSRKRENTLHSTLIFI